MLCRTILFFLKKKRKEVQKNDELACLSFVNYFMLLEHGFVLPAPPLPPPRGQSPFTPEPYMVSHWYAAELHPHPLHRKYIVRSATFFAVVL